jgi:hypothetical protein
VAREQKLEAEVAKLKAIRVPAPAGYGVCHYCSDPAVGNFRVAIRVGVEEDVPLCETHRDINVPAGTPTPV